MHRLSLNYRRPDSLHDAIHALPTGLSTPNSSQGQLSLLSLGVALLCSGGSSGVKSQAARQLERRVASIVADLQALQVLCDTTLRIVVGHLPASYSRCLRICTGIQKIVQESVASEPEAMAQTAG